ncbi:MAG: ECF transporter S component [Clostridia bacterium]|nr:ECF transporter S component [Clostridia bacterium]
MKTSTKKLTLSAMFLAIGLVLPFITGQIPQIGKMLCPMHIPILLCAFFCGPQYAGVIGAICPLMRSVMFGMPVLYPSAVGMAFELMSYGVICGLLAAKLGKDKLWKIYTALITAMLGGRLVWGLAQIVLLGIKGEHFTFAAFLAGGFVNAFPGIILQLILIPVLVRAIPDKTKKEISEE